MIILGIDPGNARCGYGVVEKTPQGIAHIASGCIETKKNTDEAVRLLQLDTELAHIIQIYTPDEAAIEALFYFKNPKTIIGVAQARGVCLRCLEAERVPSFSYTPLQVKQAVTAYGRAQKPQVLKMVMSILKLKTPPKPDDAADALAIALCHAAVPDALKKAKTPRP